jgi:pyruvate formate lyase activating enzyme
MITAQFYDELNHNSVQCTLCPINCNLENNQIGNCQIRKNEKNTLQALTFGKFCSLNIDPIEKKPLYNFYPGSQVLSLGSIGCNFHCHHCQNWQISQPHKTEKKINIQAISPEKIVDYCLSNSLNLVAFTYNEPLIQIETLLKYLPILQQKNIKTVLVTNLYINKDPLLALLPFVDALSIDLKAFNIASYKKLTTINAFEVVKGNIEICLKANKHIELVTNLVTGINDNLATLKNIEQWIEELSINIPWHITSFYQAYEYSTLSPIPINLFEEIEQLKNKSKLNYIYTRREQNTKCPNCKSIIINRNNYKIESSLISLYCPNCKKIIPYIYV